MRTLAALFLATAFQMAEAGAPRAAESCLVPPYMDDAEIQALAVELTTVLAAYPSLDKAFHTAAPALCLNDGLFHEQGYYEPKTNRIVLRTGLDPDLRLAILIHEVRHLEQYNREICPTTRMALSDYMTVRLALEADAAAIGVHIAWDLAQAGRPGPWEKLRDWPSHKDLTARYASEIQAGGDDIAATAATYAQWFADEDRRAMYAFAICSNYLDTLDRDKVNAGHDKLPEDMAARVCVMPDGRPYPCELPP